VAHCGHQGFKFLALDGWTHLAVRGRLGMHLGP
jgi:hypothetical protein